MNDFFLSDNILGNLQIIDVLVFYDYPRVFVCEDEYNLKYLFSEIDSNYDGDKWVAFKLSNSKHYKIVSNQIGLKKLFNECKNQTSYIVDKNYTNESLNISIIESLEEKFFPLNDNFVGYSEEKLQDSGLKEFSNMVGSTVFDFKLYPNNHKILDIDSVLFVNLVSKFKSLLLSFNKNLKPRLSTAPGSFIIRFNLNEENNLFSKDETDRTIRSVSSLFKADSNIEINEILEGNKTRVNTYKELVNYISRTDSNIRFSSSSPYGDEIPAVTILKDEITQTKTRLKTFYNKIEEFESFSGNLVAIDTLKKRFTFEIEDSGETIKGSIIDEIVEIYEVPSPYAIEVSVMKTIIESDKKNSIKKEYTLLSAKPN